MAAATGIMGMVVAAVQTAQAQTCDTVRAEAEALTKALPRVRAVQAVATERAQAHQQTARTPTAPARGSGASTIEAETAAAISAAVSAKAAGMGDDQAVAAAAAAAAAAEEALARGAVVFPVRSTVGLVGYPNVGKSSTVNVLVAEKKTNVSATPGKTKHFQTLRVPDMPDLMLCDCPGLVFPTVAGSKSQMVCDGILPIDQMKADYISPIRLMVQRLPAAAFEQPPAIPEVTPE